jgi:SsrA-binding protein
MILVENRRVRFEYEILETFEAGLVLQGWEAKSLRAKNVNLRVAWLRVFNEEIFLKNCKISAYANSNEIQESERERKLLLKKSEIMRLEAKQKENRATIVPTKIYTSGKNIKCEIALVRGRKKYEKRQVLKNRDADREAKKTMKDFNARGSVY